MSNQKHLASSPQSPDRRVFITESAAFLVSSTLLTSCGGSGNNNSSSTTTPTPTPTPSLTLVSISTTTPTSLTPIVVKLSGFDSTKSFAVSFSTPTGVLIPQTPIRTQTDGTVVIAAPLHLDASTGNTSAFQTTLSISQGNQTVSSPITINDLPQLKDYGVSVGVISRAFYNHQEISLGASINAQQAIAGIPQSTIKNGTLIANLQSQLMNAILARNDIDRIVSNNALTIPIGPAPDGTQISFNLNSVTLMDRIIGQYLLAYSPPPATPSVTNSSDHELPRATVSPGTIATIVQSINTLAGAVSFKSTQQTLTDPMSSTLDGVLSTLSTASTLVTIGSGVIAIGAAAAGAPVIAAAAGAVATYAALAGVLVGSASMGNDLYNVATNAYDAVTLPPGSPEQTTAKNAAEQAATTLANDAVTTFLNAEGVGGLNNPSVVGPAATSVFDSLFAATSKDIGLAAAGLVTSINGLLIPSAFKNDSDEASLAAASVGPNTDFGQVSGTLAISNSQGGILSGLTGIAASNSGSGTMGFTSIAAPDGSYNLVIPLGNSSISYNSVTISAFDPVSVLSLAQSTVNLSNMGPNGPIKGPNLSGACVDTDASTPDADDPDCD